jgi:uncharacterized protein (TIGR03435 family)
MHDLWQTALQSAPEGAMTRLGLLLILIAATGLSLAAQQPAPAFEVASIKPNRSATTAWTMGCATGTAAGNIPAGRCVGVNVSLLTLIAQAYNVPTSSAAQRISGLPEWTRSQRFDIQAKAENATATEAELKLMLRQLLAERFKLKSHKDVKEIDGYVLVVSKGGAKLTKLGEEKRASGVTLALRATTTDTLANALAARLARPVVNKTSITGNYDFRITMDSISQDNGGASLFTIIEEQYGLKLESQKVPIEVLVVDSVEPPTPD